MSPLETVFVVIKCCFIPFLPCVEQIQGLTQRIKHNSVQLLNQSLITLSGMQFFFQKCWLWIPLAMWLCVSSTETFNASTKTTTTISIHKVEEWSPHSHHWLRAILKSVEQVLWRAANLEFRKFLSPRMGGVPLSLVFFFFLWSPSSPSKMFFLVHHPPWPNFHWKT